MMQDDRSGMHIVGHVRDLWGADHRGPDSFLAPCFFLFCSHPESASRCPGDRILSDSWCGDLDYSRSCLGVSKCRLVCIPSPCPCLCPCPCPCPYLCLCLCLGREPSPPCGRPWHHSLGTPSHDRYHENQQCMYPKDVERVATLAYWEHNASGSRGRGRVHLYPCLCRRVDASTGPAMRARDHSDAAHRLARAMRSVSSRTRVWREDSTCRRDLAASWRFGLFVWPALHAGASLHSHKRAWQLPTSSRSRRLSRSNARRPAKMGFHQN